jgi:hypothetical protein
MKSPSLPNVVGTNGGPLPPDDKYPIPFLIFGFILATLMAAAAPSRSYRSRRRAGEDIAVIAAFDVFFIALICILVASIVIEYLIR